MVLSTIYTDLVGKKYIGCGLWGTTDEAFPTITFLRSNFEDGKDYYDFTGDIGAILNELQYSNVSFSSTVPDNYNQTLFFGRSPDIESSSTGWGLYTGDVGTSVRTTPTLITKYRWRNGALSSGGTLAGNTDPVTQLYQSATTILSNKVDYVVCADSSSLAIFVYKYNNNRVGFAYDRCLYYWAKMQNINNLYDYYGKYPRTSQVFMRLSYDKSTNALRYNNRLGNICGNLDYTFASTGKGNYAIIDDGSAGGAERLAADFWVYNNSFGVLGDHLVGKLPNLLLGTGAYTDMRPVRITGSKFPDGGSQWYLPIGDLYGKKLLMKCWSLM